MNRYMSRVVSIVCLLIGLTALAQHAAAVIRPYFAQGTANFTSSTDFVGSGTATHLGRYSEAGSVSFSPTGDPAVFHVEGSIVYTASNGDELHASVSGELNGATGAVTAALTYTGGTGRFASASGSSALAGQMQADGTLAVSVSGSIGF